MKPIADVRPMTGFNLLVIFQDDTQRQIDVEQFVTTGEIFEPVRNDPAYFRRVYIDSIDGTVTWPNGANIDTEVLLGLAASASSH